MGLWDCLREAGGSGDGCEDVGGVCWFVWESGGGCVRLCGMCLCLCKETQKNPVRHETLAL